MGLYSHHVKQGNSGFLGAPTVSPRFNANQMPSLGKGDESRRYSWQTSKTPDPPVPQGQDPKNRAGMWPFTNWHRTTPRDIFERNYGPELTEKMRQNARAYQEAHPMDMARYARTSSFDRNVSGTPMPDYSREFFDGPQWVQEGSSPNYNIAHAAAVKSDRLGVPEAMRLSPDIFMDLGTDGWWGTYTRPTDYYNSTLQHEVTHNLQPNPPWRSFFTGEYPYTIQRLMPGDYLEPIPYSEYNSRVRAGDGHLPYSRYPIELAPMVSETKLEYYRHLKDIPSSKIIPSLERDIANFEKRKPPEKTEYNPYDLGSFVGNFKKLLERQNEENLEQLAAARKQGLPLPTTNAPLPSDTSENILQEAKNLHDLTQLYRAHYYKADLQRNAQHRQQLEALRAASSVPPEERMNFNDPDNYSTFLNWLRNSRTPSATDTNWILDLPPEERDLYFKGIVSNQARNQPYQYYA